MIGSAPSRGHRRRRPDGRGVHSRAPGTPAACGCRSSFSLDQTDLRSTLWDWEYALPVLLSPAFFSVIGPTGQLLDAADGFSLTHHCRAHHGECSAYATLYRDGVGRAINLTGATFHAVFRVGQGDRAAMTAEYPVRADGVAHSTTVAGAQIKLECVGSIGIEHGYSPMRLILR